MGMKPEKIKNKYNEFLNRYYCFYNYYPIMSVIKGKINLNFYRIRSLKIKKNMS